MIINKLIALSFLIVSQVKGFSTVRLNRCISSNNVNIKKTQILASHTSTTSEYDEESNNYDTEYEKQQEENSINNDYTSNFLQSLEEDEESTLNNNFLREESEMLEEIEDRVLLLNQEKAERCILVGVENTSNKKYEDNYFSLDESMKEMRELIKTAGMEIVIEVTQRLNQADPRTYIGTGKVQEVNDLCIKHDCETIIFDAEISPRQQKSLENAFNKKALQNDFLGADLEIKVVDRTALILDIFAQHAKVSFYSLFKCVFVIKKYNY